MTLQRLDGRACDELRPIKIQRGFTNALGSVLVSAGNTVVLCTASVVDEVPAWMKRENEIANRGWITAEYRMLPGSVKTRKPRQDRPDGRATEIQRLIGRSLRATFDAEALGPRTVYLDCDVLQADGGTRTLSVTGASIALIDALNKTREKLPDPNRYPLKDSVVGISVGIVDDVPILDLPYEEDSRAEVDMNVVATSRGQFVEIQGTGEGRAFTDEEFASLIELARRGTRRVAEIQRESLGDAWPF